MQEVYLEIVDKLRAACAKFSRPKATTCGYVSTTRRSIWYDTVSCKNTVPQVSKPAGRSVLCHPHKPPLTYLEHTGVWEGKIEFLQYLPLQPHAFLFDHAAHDCLCQSNCRINALQTIPMLIVQGFPQAGQAEYAGWNVEAGS